jgi:hypothetical protein
MFSRIVGPSLCIRSAMRTTNAADALASLFFAFALAFGIVISHQVRPPRSTAPCAPGKGMLSALGASAQSGKRRDMIQAVTGQSQ